MHCINPLSHVKRSFLFHLFNKRNTENNNNNNKINSSKTTNIKNTNLSFHYKGRELSRPSQKSKRHKRRKTIPILPVPDSNLELAFNTIALL